MKLITSSMPSYLWSSYVAHFDRLAREGPSIIVLPEQGFDKRSEDQDWSLEDLAKHTAQSPITIVSTREDKTYVVRNGTIIPGQSGSHPARDEDYEFFYTHDKPVPVTLGNQNPVTALVRICDDALLPYRGTDRADLLIVPAQGVDLYGLEDGISRFRSIVNEHKASLHPNGHILIADWSDQIIYSMGQKKTVGKRVRLNKRDFFKVYDAPQYH